MKRMRFHLSTAVAVTLLSGAYLGTNLNPQREVVSVGRYKAGKMAWTFFPGHVIHEDCYGWPAKMFARNHADYSVTDLGSWQYSWHEDDWFARGVIVNVVFGILLCCAAAFVLERTARKCSTRKSATPRPVSKTQSTSNHDEQLGTA